MVSGYLHAARSGAKHRNLSFKEWVLGDLWEVSDGIDFKRTSQFHWTSHCNTILRFEDLETSADIIRDLVGRPDLELPHVHKAEDRGHYRDYYDDETVGVVADRFHHDIHAWGYSYY